MSPALISQFLAALNRLKKVGGTHREPVVREKFDIYRFADHKESVIDLLARVTTVSLDTMQFVDAMRDAKR